MEKVEKKDYQKPELVKYQNLKDITQGLPSGGSGDDEDVDA